jgi:ATP-dependent RNA helicase RhlE
VFSQLDFKFPEEVAVTHANKSANTRLKTVEQFESGEHRILVASDMIARGLDVSEVTHVINLNVPEVPEDYMHRVGRTGRANNAGVAITLYSEGEKSNLEAIEALMGIKIPVRPMPEGVEVSTMLIPDEEANTPGMKFIKVKQPKVENKGAAFHEKKDKNKKVPIKVTRADKMKLKYGKNYSSQHGGKK